MSDRPPTLAAVLGEHARARGDRPGLAFRSDGVWRTWSFDEYFREALRAACGLRAQGVAPGDRVLMLVVEPESAAALVLGAWLAGAVPIQIGVPYRLTDTAAFIVELESTAGKLRANVLVLSDSLVPSERPERPRVVATGEIRSAPPDRGALTEADKYNDIALIQLTSGSTGSPRGVVIGHDELVLHVESMSRALPLARDGMSAVSWLPLHHDMGLVGGLLFPLYNGFPVYLLSPMDFRSRPFAWLETLSEVRAGGTAAPPSAYSVAVRFAERARDARLDFSALECAMIGAEPISARLIRAFSEAFAPCGFRPEAFFPVYGLAEATVAVTFPPLHAPTRIDRASRSSLEREGIAKTPRDELDVVEWVGVGSAIPNSEIRIVDDAVREVADRVVGEIEVRSNTLFRGYFDDPETTSSAFRDGWFRTGDLGYVADGCLFVTGRKKDVIIKGGHNLSPAAVEELVGAVDGIRPGCVAAVGVYVPEIETEELWVMAETKLDAAEHRALSHRVRDALKAHGIAIDQVRLVEPGTLPKTTSGKIQRTRVREDVRAARVARAVTRSSD